MRERQRYFTRGDGQRAKDIVGSERWAWAVISEYRFYPSQRTGNTKAGIGLE